jgi:hypothetical protein
MLCSAFAQTLSQPQDSEDFRTQCLEANLHQEVQDGLLQQEVALRPAAVSLPWGKRCGVRARSLAVSRHPKYRVAVDEWRSHLSTNAPNLAYVLLKESPQIATAIHALQGGPSPHLCQPLTPKIRNDCNGASLTKEPCHLQGTHLLQST